MYLFINNYAVRGAKIVCYYNSINILKLRPYGIMKSTGSCLPRLCTQYCTIILASYFVM